MKGFSKNFFKQYKIRIIGYSFLRMFSFVQVLFWPLALAKVINIMTENSHNWRQALVWAGLMVVNKITEDVVRLRSKYGLEAIATELRIKLAIFLSEKTKIRKNVKTGEAVQAIKMTSEAIGSLMMYYKENLLQLPVNFIIVPMVLLKASSDYFLILIALSVSYLLTEYFFSKLYSEKFQAYLRASEIFWGTTYRKLPDRWRQRNGVDGFDKQIERQGKRLDKVTDTFLNVNNWRWVAVQVIASISIGTSVFLVFYKAINGLAPIGDLVLVIGYLGQVQGSLNIISTALSHIRQMRLAIKRLNKTVKIRPEELSI